MKQKLLFGIVFTLCSLAPQGVSAIMQIDVEGNSVAWESGVNGENLGTTMASGDVNGDGIDDLLIGNPGYDEGAENRGRAYLVYGSPNTAASPFDNNTLTSAVTFTGISATHSAGSSVALIDVDNDGYDDIFIGRTGSGTNGAIHLIYGQSSALTSITLNDASVKTFTGQSGVNDVGYVGDSSIVGGDINGDGLEDVIVGAKFHGSNGEFLYGPGAVYVKYGLDNGDDFISGSFSSFDVKINGVSDDDLPKYTGSAIAIGNLNNDAYDDIIIGAYGTNVNSNTDAGKVHIIYGAASLSSTINLSGLTDIEITGVATYDELGKGIAASDLNADGYDDILVGAPGDDTGADSAGAVSIIYGQSTTLSAGSISNYPKLYGTRASGATGTGIAGGRDLNNDNKQDIVIGTPGTSIGGQAHILFGSTNQETSGTLSEKADILLNSLVGNHQNNFGASFALGDFNGDGSPQFTDIAIGAPTTGPNKGAVYTFFQRFDNDDDGYDSPNADYVLFSGTDCDETNIALYTNYTFYQDEDNDNSGTGATQTLCQGASPSAPNGYRTSVSNTTDCNDADATVSTNQTYYLDADGDGISSETTTETICSTTPSSGYRTSVTGNNDCNDADATVSRNQTYYQDEDEDGLGSDITIAECSLTAPNGYVANSNDTDDTIANNGVEISGDGIDNDGDGSTDEDNTIPANGAHPGYKNLSVASADDYKNAIRSISALTNGKVRITFKDNSVYVYTIFNEKTTKKTRIKIIRSTGRILAVSSNGKSFKLVNAFSGNTFSTLSGIKSKKSYKTHNLLVKDIRSDGSLEAVLISRDKGKTAYVAMIRITQKNTLKMQARKEFSGVPIDVKKTKIKTASIELRDTKRKVLRVLNITKLYEFRNPK